MKIEVLGTGCPKCKKLMELTTEVVREMNSSAAIVKVDQINDIITRGVMLIPALIIDGKVLVSGRVPSKEEIRKWLDEKTVK